MLFFKIKLQIFKTNQSKYFTVSTKWCKFHFCNYTNSMGGERVQRLTAVVALVEDSG